ncbi:hypothetical protein CMQ_4436 [Grosmannia clavigera kw1407]|uniref:Uncharacterized protein n=1 Tax=Grosmannia clavigera (strain kw1407 / UAMH 11150) TaxID=655863 RepID=F0XV05_GROCL|nr:uncharacterized protein CMQ_4436 [Grosmannia clavigera kw1407]EFW98584.1 hypothetical protein CMQ_4436 [Grosmannia clavigera kw1407]
MRNRFKKSSRSTSISSAQSPSNSPQKLAVPGTTQTPAPSTPNDLAKPSLVNAPPASVNTRTMGISSGLTSEEKRLPTTPAPANVSRKLSTIRTVTTSDDGPRASSDDDLPSDASASITRNSNSTFSGSENSATSAASSASHSLQNDRNITPSSRLNQSTLSDSDDPVIRPGSPEAMPARSEVDIEHRGDISSLAVPERSLTRVISNSSLSQEGVAMTDDRQGEGAGANGWDSTVGKAGLGKTGRVINRLVSDNETLKRDLKLESLKADESRQAAKLLEDKMERMVSEYESRLLEASVTKTLLARKERQVESLQGVVELEKQRATDAKDRERIWREEMDKVKKESKQQVEEATAHAALMEGRYNAISSHWRDQGDAVKQALGSMAKEVKELAEARRQDDDKITTLRDLCDQQDGNIRLLWQQKEDITRKYEAYKKEQEDALRDIKANAAKREAEQEQMLEEARQVLDKLRWALNVKNNVAWAE